ncbi:family 43 glycosylhydrolase [Weissella diestrammenae]|uniref:Family 43 glycosylhydrolase n=1 Tax=Weissella diestrammenae TaxID=1162633 RepID=A0A7G9T4L1_9LACO|nr:glycoside hydrolase family 43 protein [Weissella diestrammenae]MCM0582061.1 family 43 glycosylhydrolase [Weissella diestrammenae]QNN75036.1 family 43 glycosylhydrolase [Weissella diestrammenae]
MAIKTYTNPIIKGFYPDPSICKRGNDYFLVNSSFGYTPGIPLFHSTDLVNWTQIGNCLENESAVDLTGSPSSGGIFAPTIRYHEGMFYVIVTNAATRENFFIRSSNPYEGWSVPILVPEWGGIDPSLFFDDDGKVYIQGTENFFTDEVSGIYQAQIDLENGNLLSERKLICAGTGGASPEGPHIYKLNGYYYLLLAEGGTEYAHMVTLFRSQDVNGPYMPYKDNPILSNRSIENTLQCIGHADLIVDQNNRPWIVCLGVRAQRGHSKYHHLGRETMLVPLKWDEEGWPTFINSRAVNTVMEGMLTNEQQEKNNSFNIDFTQTNMIPKNWVYLRNPVFENYSFTSRGLALNNATNSLSTDDSITFVGFRQTEFNTNLSINLAINQSATGDSESGLTVYMSKRFHYDLGIVKEQGDYYLIFRRTIGYLDTIIKKVPINSTDNIALKLISDSTDYKFGALINGNMIDMGIAESLFLAPEVTNTFTGVMYGLYATELQKLIPEQNLCDIQNVSYSEWT